jgi:hypothetical protein
VFLTADIQPPGGQDLVEGLNLEAADYRMYRAALTASRGMLEEAASKAAAAEKERAKAVKPEL